MGAVVSADRCTPVLRFDVAPVVSRSLHYSKKVFVKFWVGTTAMLTTDVYLTVTLLFYVRMVLVPA